MISYCEALHILDSYRIDVETELLPIAQAVGRLLPTALQSPVTQPLFDTARMDGYAVAAGETGINLPVAGTAAAGSSTAWELQQGECLRIMTGATVPRGAARVIPRELVEEQENRIRITGQSSESHITPAGSYLRRGAPLLQPRVLRPADIGTLAWAGIAEVEVLRPIATTILSTGDELRSAGSPLQRGEIYDAVGPLLSARAARSGLKVARCSIVGDAPGQLKKEIWRGLEESSLLLLSGGISRGDFDYTAEALESCGVRPLFHRVAVKPGRPVYVGLQQRDDGSNRFVFGLPGNPVSAFLDYVLFVERLIRLSAGLRAEPRGWRLRLSAPVRPSDPARAEAFPIALDDGQARPLGYRDSGNIRGFAAADGLLLLAAGAAGMAEGTEVYVRPL